MKVSDPNCPAWIASPEALDVIDEGDLPDNYAENRALMAKLVERREDLDVFGVVAAPDWDFEEYALVRLDRDYYLLYTRGCSCESPEAEWNIAQGPTTLELIAWYIDSPLHPSFGEIRRRRSDFVMMIAAAMADEGRCFEHEACRTDHNLGRACWNKNA